MIPDELRRKLEEITRGPLKMEVVHTTVRGRESPRKADGPARLEDLIAGEAAGTPERPFYLIRRPLEEFFPRARELTTEFRSVWVRGRYALSDEELDRQWREIIETDPDRLLFLDIETLGLTATPVFLVGMMSLDQDGRFQIRQLFARNYSEEPHVLAHLADTLRDDHVLVTYNGKSFDWPYLRDRAVYHSLAMIDEPGHLDLLKEARRRWKSVLPNCQLQTLEYHVSGRRRVGDLPGSMIPEAYHRYVRTGDARPMLDVIHHNALDLVTMAELMLFILQGGDIVWE